MEKIYFLRIFKLNYGQKLISMLLMFFIVSCTTATIEEQVEEIFIEKDSIERKEIAIDLAKTENVNVIDLINKHYSENLVLTEEANKDLLLGYSKILDNNSFDNKSNVINCIKLMTEPDTISMGYQKGYPEPTPINSSKIKYIIYGLTIDGTKDFENCLVASAKKHGRFAMKSIIKTWQSGNNSNGLLNSIISFDTDAIGYLCIQLEDEIKNEDLLARIGKAAVPYLEEQMGNSEQYVRFAAADALVKMITYHPEAVKSLTNALNNESLDIITNNYPFYIRLGLKGTEEILLKALDYNFSENMGVDYLNCGNPEIESRTKEIANNHGYNIIPGFGGHNGPRWGSEEVDE
jgi:hypothetical protein